ISWLYSRSNIMDGRGRSLSMEAIPALSIEDCLHVDVSQIEIPRWVLPSRNEVLRNPEGHLALARLQSVITVVVHVQFGIDSPNFGSVSLEEKLPQGISLTLCHQVIQIRTRVIIVQLHFGVGEWLIPAEQDSPHSCRLIDQRRDERKDEEEKGDGHPYLVLPFSSKNSSKYEALK
ncbi:hypothetical protein PMAYCL1PPCAC_09553, partial [Pristionchus mayeri]